MTHEERVALVYVLIYAVPVLGLAALVSWRVAGKSNRAFRGALPIIAITFAALVGIGLVIATHYMEAARAG